MVVFISKADIVCILYVPHFRDLNNVVFPA